MRPVIGITCNWEEEQQEYRLRADYVRMVEQAGGIPVILPETVDDESLAAIENLCAGFLFSGGGDIDPLHWGDLAGPNMGEIEPGRDRFELSLARRAFYKSKPALGICRGSQLLNVAAGGSLIQHLEGGLCHDQNAPRHYPIHDIVVEEGSLLHSILQVKTLRVNSFHHQAIHRPGAGLLVNARSHDEIAEGLESSSHSFWLGVQWHPECMRDEASKKLFYALIKACVR